MIVMLIVILFLSAIAVLQIKMAGMEVRDFWTFVKANDTLDKLYAFSKKYEKLSPQQQVLFLHEAEKVFSAFDKVPDALWEEEYNKYMEILSRYKDIKIIRWEATSTK
jgi:RPA family protein